MGRMEAGDFWGLGRQFLAGWTGLLAGWESGQGGAGEGWDGWPGDSETLGPVPIPQ